VFRHGRARRDDLFTVIAASSGFSHPRLGLAISKKSAKLASQRNRVKRLVRQAFRTSTHCLPPVDIVVIARPGIASRSNAEIQRSIRAHWKRLARQCAKPPTV
jgi:ribonuclease P protein component